MFIDFCHSSACLNLCRISLLLNFLTNWVNIPAAGKADLVVDEEQPEPLHLQQSVASPVAKICNSSVLSHNMYACKNPNPVYHSCFPSFNTFPCILGRV